MIFGESLNVLNDYFDFSPFYLLFCVLSLKWQLLQSTEQKTLFKFKSEVFLLTLIMCREQKLNKSNILNAVKMLNILSCRPKCIKNRISMYACSERNLELSSIKFNKCSYLTRPNTLHWYPKVRGIVTSSF